MGFAAATLLARPLRASPLSRGVRSTPNAISRARHVDSRAVRRSFSLESGSSDRVLLASLGLVGGGSVATTLLREAHWYLSDDDSVSGQMRMALQSFKRRAQAELQDENHRAIAALIAANVGVWGLWRVSFRHAGLHRFMWRHFACSYSAVVEGRRVHTLLTSAFSHITLPHIGINMFMLWEFGTQILAPKDAMDSWLNKALARSRTIDFLRSSLSTTASLPQLLTLEDFGKLYVSSALASSTLSIVASRFRGTPRTFTIGASGAVMGVLTVYCLLFPERRMMLYGFIDLTSSQLLQLMTAVNLVGSAFQRSLQIDFTGHLGGQVVGLVVHENEPRIA